MAILYSIVVAAHGLNRWAVLLSAVWLLARSVSVGRSTPTGSVRKAYRVCLGTLRVQFVLGVILLFTSPVARAAWVDLGTAMRVAQLRFFILEHPVMMIAAIGLAESGLARVMKARDEKAAARAALVFVTLSLLVILAAIPWPSRDAVARPLLRGF
jgi:hypothetical protein